VTSWWDPVSDEECLQVDCPFCGVKRGTMCVYTAPYGKVNNRYVVGEPCKRPHYQRRDRARNNRARLERLDRRPIHPATLAQREAVHLAREFDLLEYNQLREWLRANADVLLNAGKEP
jgi:hypothetical protein